MRLANLQTFSITKTSLIYTRRRQTQFTKVFSNKRGSEISSATLGFAAMPNGLRNMTLNGAFAVVGDETLWELFG